MTFSVDETTMIECAGILAHRYGSAVEWVSDNRYGLGDRGWRCFRFRVRGDLFRRFYLHPSGLAIEGGRGGARIFEPPLSPPAERSPVPVEYRILHTPLARVPSITAAAMIVEALSA